MSLRADGGGGKQRQSDRERDALGGNVAPVEKARREHGSTARREAAAIIAIATLVTGGGGEGGGGQSAPSGTAVSTGQPE